MGRAPCCDKANVKRGPWSPDEDATLKRYLDIHGTGGNWIALPQKAGLKRCGKSCRLRWLNYLRPDIKHGGFTEEEDNIICTLYSQMGSRWSLIASQLPGRTDNDVKNYWNTKLKKKILAGKRSLTINNSPNNIAPTSIITNSSSTACSTSLIPCAPKAETEISPVTLSDYSLNQSSAKLPAFVDIGYGPYVVNSTQSLDVDQFQFYYPAAGVMDASEFGPATSLNSTTTPLPHIVSPSQEGSSISDSSSVAVDNNKGLSLPSDGSDGLEDAAAGILMDSGFSFPIDPVNGLLFQDKATVGANWYPYLADYGYIC